MTHSPVYVGVDLGTSSLKVLAVDAAGETRGQARSAYTTFRPTPGAAEQEPADWTGALREALSDLGRQVAASTWRGIGLTGMIPTLVVLDSARQPLGRAVTWQDDRAARHGDAMRTNSAVGDLYAATGQWVDGRYLLPMATAARDRDRRLAAGVTVAGAKDYLFAELTGELVTDPSTAAGYGCYDLAAGRWLDAVTDGWILPPVAPASTVLPAAAAAAFGVPSGLPIVLGAADSVLGADAAGATEPGDVAYLTGSSTIMLRRVQTPTPDEAHRYLLTPMADGGYGAEMDLLATGSAVAWMTSILVAEDPARGISGLDADPFQPGLPLMLPYLTPGEQGALWDDAVSGTVAGLTLAHTGADLVRALANGIVVESARCLSVFGAVFGAIRSIRAGGAAVSVRMAQDLADATDLRVDVLVACGTYSGYGAAQLAAQAIDAVEIPSVAIEFVADPDGERHDRWSALAGRHDELRRRLDGWSR